MMSLVSRFFTLESLQKALRGIHIPAAEVSCKSKFHFVKVNST